MQLTKNIPLHNVKQKQIKDVIKKATQKKRSQRYQSAAEFRVAVDKLVPLQYPAKTLDIKTISISIGSAAALIGIVFGVINLLNNSDTPDSANKDIIAQTISTDEDNQQRQTNDLPQESYNCAVNLLSNKDTAKEGLAMLESLANKKDYNSAFLLSRLYFNSPESVRIGAFSDSIARFRNNLGIIAQNKEAHRLLKKAVILNSEDYRSLFELGCDYKSKKRGATFNTDSAYIYLNKARQLAAKAGDKEYEQAIANRMINLKPAK
jgi:hypothetical protein